MAVFLIAMCPYTSEAVIPNWRSPQPPSFSYAIVTLSADSGSARRLFR
jgi:hypothetical protein